MADFREYQGVDFSTAFLVHYGVGHDKGGHSGRYPWGSGKNPKHPSPLSTPYDVDSAKREYKKAKRRKKFLKAELKQKRALRDDAKEAYDTSKEGSTGILFKRFDDSEQERRYKVAKRENKYAKAVAKETKAQLQDAKYDLSVAKENYEAEKQREKGQNDAMKDAWTVLSSNPDFRGNQPSGRDLRGYAKRHPDEMDSLVTNILSAIGGTKVTGEYKEAYEKEFNEWIKYADEYYDTDQMAKRLTESSKHLKVRS